MISLSITLCLFIHNIIVGQSTVVRQQHLICTSITSVRCQRIIVFNFDRRVHLFWAISCPRRFQSCNGALTGNLWIITLLLIFVPVVLITSYARHFALKLTLICSLEGVVDGRNCLPIHVPYLGLFLNN